ncbi:alpha/beta fold hydrolase [Kibdelosporangium aridum]|nr:alpha/beta fold hydrolase [Kibdelosporangium aridum]
MSVPLPEKFRTERIDVDGIMINCAVAGEGPPLLMLHGYPQTHLMWHHIAPPLAERFTVVLADLRGYGDSAKPEPTASSDNYAKRAMAADQVGLMARLGFDRFALVGHDRGAASRTASPWTSRPSSHGWLFSTLCRHDTCCETSTVIRPAATFTGFSCRSAAVCRRS